MKKEFDYYKFASDRKRVMTAQQLGECSDFTYNTIANLETGRRKIKPNELNHLCDILGLNASDYLSGGEAVVCSFLSNKGGSTKTTSCLNSAYSLATKYKKRTLILDCDLQQNLTQHIGALPNDEKNFYLAFSKKESVLKHITYTPYPMLDIVVGADAVSVLEQEMNYMELRELRMREILKEAKTKYDFILCDCNPSLGLLNKSVIYGSDSLIIPLEPSAFGLRGINFVIQYFEQIKQNHQDIKILGILINRLSKNKLVSKDVIKIITDKYNIEEKLVFDTKIETDTSIEKAQMLSLPVGDMFPKSRASQSFDLLAKEIIDRAEML